MANKITIRRVGGLLPAISLVVLVLLVSLIVWLSTAGLPARALRYLEAEAAKQGIYLHIGKLKLSPSSGLALRARRVQLYAAAGDTEPLATLERATFGISAGALLRGKVQPTTAEFRNLDVALPTDGDSPLLVEDATASAIIRNGRYVRFTAATARLQGIPVTLHGAFTLSEKEAQATSEPAAPLLPLDLPALLQPWQEKAGYVQRAIARQNWQPGELPSIDLNLSATRRTQLSARVNIPRYDEGQFHFREVFIDLAYQNNTLIINKIHFFTTEPDSEVTLQGGYDIPERHLSLNLQSTAALTRMAEAVSLHGVQAINGVDMQSITHWLERFRHPDDEPPAITLRGDVYFEEDFSPKALSITGQLNQKNFTFGQTAVDDLHLSFYYRDGGFNIDRMRLAFPTGSLILSASASRETLKGTATVIADLDIPHLLQFASEFTEAPLRLPEGLVLTGNLQLDATAMLDMPEFVAGSTRLEQFLPVVRELEANVQIAEAAHHNCRVVQPSLHLTLSGLSQPEGALLPQSAEIANLRLSAKQLALARAEEGARELALNTVEARAELRQLGFGEAGSDSARSAAIAAAKGELRVGELSLGKLRVEALEAELSDLRRIRPLAGDWRQLLQEGALRLSTGAMHAEDTLLGALDSQLQIAANGQMDIVAVIDREEHRMHLELHPQLTAEGVLTLSQVQLELPVLGFEPLLALAGVNISAVRLPDSLALSGSASYDTRAGYLRHAEGQLSIPHIVRTPGDGVAVFAGKEIPLALHLQGHANGREGGGLDFAGDLQLVHKGKREADDRKLSLSFAGDTARQMRMKGSTNLDVGILDQLIDLASVHSIMRDFRSTAATRSDVEIRDLLINWEDGLLVSASCDASLRNMGYQMNAYSDVRNAQGQPTGKEKLRTDFGKAPFRLVSKCDAHVDVLYREDAEGRELDDRVSILDASITYDNRPWLQQQGIQNGVNFTSMQVGAVIIDLKDSFVELRNIHGKAYPAYAIGAYYEDLPGFMEDIILNQPATLETKYCLFPYSKKSPRDIAGNIRMEAARAGYRFLGTTFPLTTFSGFIWFKPGTVGLDRLNAACWDGAMDAAINIDYSGENTGFDGYVLLRNINLQPLAAAYDSKQSPALCNGSIRFRSPRAELSALQAYGDAHIVNGDLMNLRLFRPVGALISDLPANLASLERRALNNEDLEATWFDRQVTRIFQFTGNTLSNVGESVSKMTSNIPFANHFLSYDLQEAHCNFSIGKGKLVTQDLQASGNNLDVDVRLSIDLDKQQLDGDLWPKISSVPTVILSPITFLSEFMIDIRVFGPLNNIDWSLGLKRRDTKSADECSVRAEGSQR